MPFNGKKIFIFVLFIIVTPFLFFYSCENPFSPDKDDISPVLSISTNVLYFGKTLTEKTFFISNIGGKKANKTPRTLEWWIQTDSDVKWCQFLPDAGTDSDTVTVTINRIRLSSGEHSAVLTIKSNGGTKELKVHAVGQ